MGVFDDMSQFLEARLDEFLQAHPHLELRALEEQLREQEVKTQQLIQSLQTKEQVLQKEILTIAEEIKLWNQRIAKAERAQRFDLVEPAREREAALLRQGNQLWGQLAGVKQNIPQSQGLLTQTQAKRQEIKQKLFQVSPPSPPRQTSGWSQPKAYSKGRDRSDPIEAKFQDWEIEQDLEQLKRNLGK